MLGRRSKLQMSFDQRVTLEERDESSKNAMNEVVESWITLGDRWARIRPVSGREFIESQQTQAVATHRIDMRSDPVVDDLTTKHRFKQGDRVYNITRKYDVEGHRSELVSYQVQEAV